MASNIEDIEDIFGFPTTKKERENIPSDENFSDKVEEMGEIMKTVDNTVPVSDVALIEVDENKTEKTEAEKEATKEQANDSVFDEIDDLDSAETKAEEPLEELLDKPSSDDSTETEDVAENVMQTNDITTEDIDLPEGEISWITKSESAKFDYFYKQKISIIRDVLKGKQLPFSKYEEELRNSYCDVRSNIFDLPQLHKNMTLVQSLRDRVCQIQSDVNSQYYKWDRIVELLRGVLARTLYERGKQDGVQFEHMRDMEIYLESLKSIHKTADIIHKNLDAASDLLSRQVTIAQSDKSINRNSSSYNNSDVSSSPPIETYIKRETPETLADYDELPSDRGTITKRPNVKEKSVRGVEKKNWDEM